MESAKVFDFSDFGIIEANKGFSEPKISIDEIINEKITVLDHQYVKTQNGERLVLRFKRNDEIRIAFTDSKHLREAIDAIKEMEKDGVKRFPFNTVIRSYKIFGNHRMKMYKFTSAKE